MKPKIEQRIKKLNDTQLVEVAIRSGGMKAWKASLAAENELKARGMDMIAFWACLERIKHFPVNYSTATMPCAF